jgi:hypothetical protein
MRAVEWGLEKFVTVPGQITAFDLYLDKPNFLSVEDPDMVNCDEDDDVYLGMFCNISRRIRVACAVDQDPDVASHDNAFDVCATIFHEIGHSLQAITGGMGPAMLTSDSEHIMEEGTDHFAAVALGMFVTENYDLIREVFMEQKKEPTPEAPRKSIGGKLRTF